MGSARQEALWPLLMTSVIGFFSSPVAEEAIDKARDEVSGGKTLSPGAVFEAYKARLDPEAKSRQVSRWVKGR